MKFGFALLIAAFTGFISLSYEIVWFRAYSYVSQGRPHAFGLLLGFFLLGIAVGSLASRALCRDSQLTFNPSVLRYLAGFVLAATVLGFSVVPFLKVNASVWPWTFPFVSFASGAMGATFPLVSHFGILPDHRAGSRLSLLYLSNIVGSSLGSLLTGFVLLNVLSLQTTTLLLTSLGCGLAAILIFESSLKGLRAVAWLSACALVLAIAVVVSHKAFERLYESLQFKGRDPDARFETLLENRNGVIAISTDKRVYGGGVYDGVVNTDLVHDRNSLFRAYAISALHPAPKRVLMIGLSAGAWAQVISHLPQVEHLTVVEINPGYLKVIPHYPAVADILSNPQISIVIDDGRRWLTRHPQERFDIVVQNTTWHWCAHISNLLSVEYLELVRAHLNPQGIFYYNTTSSRLVERTAVETFPYVLRVYNFVAVSDSPIEFNTDRFSDALMHAEIQGRPPLRLEVPEDKQKFNILLALGSTLQGEPTRFGLESRESIAARTMGARIITDDNMASEWEELAW